MRQIAQVRGSPSANLTITSPAKRIFPRARRSARSPYPRIIAELDKLDGATGPELIRQAFSRLQTMRWNMPVFSAW
jgi:hypothetical protein